MTLAADMSMETHYWADIVIDIFNRRKKNLQEMHVYIKNTVINDWMN